MGALKIAAVVALVSIMLAWGLQLDRRKLVALLKDYGLLSRALLANFIIVPLLAMLLVRLFQLSDDVATGILLMAIAPGGLGMVLSGARKADGSFDLAVSLRVIFSLLSFFTIPIVAPLVLPSGAAAKVPITNLIVLLLFQLVPLLIGLVVARAAPKTAKNIARPLKLVALVCFVGILVFLAPDIVKAVPTVIGSRGILTAVCLTVLALVTGYMLGGPTPETRHTLSISTSARTFAVALVIALGQFRGTNVAAVVMTYVIVQAVGGALAAAYFTRTAKLSLPAQ